MRIIIQSAGMLIAVMLAAMAPALTQSGQKPIHIIVPFPPGAATDGIARLIANELAPRLNRSIVVDNKPGAGGSLGLMILAKAQPDGDMLGIGATGALVITPNLPGNEPPFDPLRELAPIAQLTEIPNIIVANPATGPATVQELIARAKTQPQGLTYGSTGTNSGQHLIMEFLKHETGANLVHVPYRGSAQAVTDVLGGQVPVASVDLTSALPFVETGKLIALGVPHAKRTPSAPQIPTIAENGLPGFARSPGYVGLFAPAGTPPDILQRLSREIGAILATPDAQMRVRQLSLDMAYLDSAAFATYLAVESQKWKQSLKSIGLAN